MLPVERFCLLEWFTHKKSTKHFFDKYDRLKMSTSGSDSSPMETRNLT